MPCILLSDCSSALMDDLYEYECQPTLKIKNYSEFSFDSFIWEPPNQKKKKMKKIDPGNLILIRKINSQYPEYL